jgi:glycosyltransferase involved in cell wall biosynthesis
MHKLTARPRLTLDIHPLLEERWTGIPVFTRRLVQALLRHGGIEVEFACRLARIPTDQVLEAIRLSTGAYLNERLDHDSDDAPLADPNTKLLFPSVKSSFGTAVREASVVHDMSTLFMPETHEPANVAHHLDRFAEELATDDAVFCVSEATSDALVSAFPSARSKTRILHQYVDWPENFALMDRNLPPVGFHRYAVVLGTLEPRKNLELLLRALELPEMARSDLTFLIIGRQGWLFDAFAASLPEAARRRLVFSGFVSEFMKYRLLAHAEFLVFPSIYEGFGIPALEAMSLGKPVLASRSSAFPEIVGDAGIYFDPLSPTDFAAGLAEIEPAGMLGELSCKAIENSRSFGWERMVRPVMEWVKE